jgi:hypothetical protein
MKTSSKTKAAAIALVLTLSLAASMMLLPTASAHTPAWQIPTYAYIHAVPNPVGVGQTVSVYIWLTNYYYGAGFTNDLRFHNYKLSITAPNGAVTTQNFPVVKDTTSNQHTTFVPDQVGEYTLEFTYPGQTYTETDYISSGIGMPPGPNPYTNDTFLASSASMKLTVQQEQLPAAIGGYPLPNEYWARPIYGENTNWWEISSNWLGLGAPGYGGYTNFGGDNAGGECNGQQTFPGDAVGPQTAHVMWTKPLQSGGVVGGNNFDVQGQTFFDGSAYIIRYNNPIILDGKLYYTEPVGFSNTGYSMGVGGSGYGPTDCVDLRTGEVIWSRTDVPALTMGLLMDVQTQNEHGVCPPILIARTGGHSLFGNLPETWTGYDGDTGNQLFTVNNVPQFGPARVMGPDGEYMNYVFANAGDEENPDWRLGEWNSSLLFLPVNAGAPSYAGTIDGSISDPSDPNCRYDWNVSVPWLNTMPPSSPGTNSFATFYAGANTPVAIVSAKYGDGILCYNGTLPANGENMLFGWESQAPYTYFFVNLNASKGTIGQVLWWKTLQPPANNYTVVSGGVDWETRVFLQSYKENVQWVAYNLASGEHLWTAEPQTAMDYYGSPGPGVLGGQVAYGRLYSSGMGGILYCYDDKTGDLLWTYGNGGEGNSTNSGFNWPYGNIPTMINAVGNGVVYTVTSEHTWVSPIYKGGMARAINATDGSEIWTISSVTMEFGMTSYAIADGFATWFNGYDNQIYVVGRGPSATTVTASPKVSTHGGTVVVEGTVMDISTGTSQDEQAARFPNGVPAISDASMTDWMGYIYQQKPLPADATGVEVTLSVLDPNNNCYDVATATSDTKGFYSAVFTPLVPGKYTVIATFAGTNGYWSSYAETAINVEEAPAATPEPTPVPASLADMYFLPMSIVTIILIVVVGVVLFLMLRKR